MKASELRQKSKAELKEILEKDREKLRQFRFDLASGKVKDVRNIRIIKKDVARILTIMSEISNAKAQMSNQAQSPKSK